jgi:Tfp pilus assembly PilM family ATPase
MATIMRADPSSGPRLLVEVGADWLKIAEADSGRGAALKRLQLIRLAAEDSPVQALTKVFTQWKTPHPRVVACLPRQAVTVRMVNLPSTNPAEIADMVELQAGKHTPYSADEIASHYRIVGSGRQGFTRILLAIVQRPVLRQRFAWLEEAGAFVERMTVSTEGILSWQNACGVGGPGAFALLDVDAECSDFLVFANGGLAYSRSILIGGAQLLAEFAQCKDRFAREIRQSLDTCLGEQPGLSIGKLLITGAGLHVPELVTHLGPQLGLQPECVDALQAVKRLPTTPSLRDPAYQSLSMTALAGIALAPARLELNLVPDSVLMRRRLLQRARSLTALAMLLMTLFFCGAFYAITRLALQSARLERLRAVSAAEQLQAGEVERMREIVRLVRARRDATWSPANLLLHVQKARPEHVYVSDSIELNTEQPEQQLVVAGLADTIKDVRAFVQGLEQQPVFKDVTEGQTKMDNQGRFKFQVVCSLEVPR